MTWPTWAIMNLSIPIYKIPIQVKRVEIWEQDGQDIEEA